MGEARLGLCGCHRRKGHPCEAEVQLEKQCLGTEVSRICAPNHELDSLLRHISHYSWKVVMEQNLLLFVCLGFVCVFLGWRGLSVMKQGEQILLNIRRKHLVTSAYVCANAT